MTGPICTGFNPGTIACFPRAVNPLATDLVSGMQEHGPNGPNETVGFTLAQVASFAGVGNFLALTGGTLSGPLTLAGNATTALQAVPLQQLLLVNVLDHGATGNGTTDDTPALQSIMNTYAGKAIVYVPRTSGSYMVSTLSPPSNLHIIIDGTIKRIAGTYSGAGVFNMVSASHIRIEGSGIIDGGSPANVDGAGIGSATSCSDIRITGITLQNAGYWNLNITQSSDVVVNGVSFIGGGAANEFAAGASECWLTNCYFDNTGNGDYAFCFYGGVTNSGAIGNTIKNAGSGLASSDQAPGIGVLSDVAQPAPCHNIIIANNVCHDGAGPGFVLLGYDATHISTGLVLANNRSYNNDKHGVGFVAGADVFVDFVTDVKITGNMISDNGNPTGPYYTGIFLGPHSNRLTVTDNHIFNIGSGLGPAGGGNNNAGIYAANPTDAYISNNHFYDQQMTPSMAYSVIGGVLSRSSFIGNYFGVPFNCLTSPDTVFANATNNGFWTVGGTAAFNSGLSSFAPIGVRQGAAIANTDWQNSGGFIGWNYATDGATNFINSRGSGPGGFTFYNTDSSIGATPTLLVTIDGGGGLTANALSSPIMIASGSVTNVLATKTGTSYAVAATDYALILNPSGSFTLTLPAASPGVGRVLELRLIAAQTVSSASSNVVPLAGGSPGTAILTGTAGKWATLQSDGTNWQIMAAN